MVEWVSTGRLVQSQPRWLACSLSLATSPVNINVTINKHHGAIRQLPISRSVRLQLESRVGSLMLPRNLASNPRALLLEPATFRLLPTGCCEPPPSITTLFPAVMVRRISEFKQKLHPNAKLRAWYASHTFGGTTKAKSLKILGFSKQNFYYIAAGVGAAILVIVVVAVIGVKGSVKKAKLQGAEQGYVGQPVVQSTTAIRTRTLVSNGQTILTTETSAYVTTFQRGGGITKITTTNEKGQAVTVPGSLLITMNSDGKVETITYVASEVFLTDSNGVGEKTLVFGDPTVITSNGQAIATTKFDGIAVTTDSGGKTVTNAVPKPGATASSSAGAAATGSSGSKKPTFVTFLCLACIISIQTNMSAF